LKLEALTVIVPPCAKVLETSVEIPAGLTFPDKAVSAICPPVTPLPDTPADNRAVLDKSMLPAEELTEIEPPAVTPKALQYSPLLRFVDSASLQP
jgi:hypothetical protein